MLGHDKSSTPRNTGGSQTAPPANAAQWSLNHQGSRHAPSWKNEIPLHRLGGRGKKGREDPCRLELAPTAPSGAEFNSPTAPAIPPKPVTRRPPKVRTLNRSFHRDDSCLTPGKASSTRTYS